MIEDQHTQRVVRLFCFAHAGGGGTVFRPWRTFLPDIEVHPVVLPGREARWRERPHTEMGSLARDLLTELLPWLTPPFAFFGHSMGAAIAYELSSRLCDLGITPTRLFVSGRRPPQIPARAASSTRHMNDEQFVSYLRSLNGVPAEVLAHGELLSALLPTIRADFLINETYAAPVRRLPLPVSALTGENDPLVSPAEMLSWRDVTDLGFRLRVFAGDHFYLTADSAGVCAAIRSDLAGAVESPAHSRSGAE